MTLHDDVPWGFFTCRPDGVWEMRCIRCNQAVACTTDAHPTEEWLEAVAEYTRTQHPCHTSGRPA